MVTISCSSSRNNLKYGFTIKKITKVKNKKVRFLQKKYAYVEFNNLTVVSKWVTKQHFNDIRQKCVNNNFVVLANNSDVTERQNSCHCAPNCLNRTCLILKMFYRCIGIAMSCTKNLAMCYSVFFKINHRLWNNLRAIACMISSEVSNFVKCCL